MCASVVHRTMLPLLQMLSSAARKGCKRILQVSIVSSLSATRRLRHSYRQNKESLPFVLGLVVLHVSLLTSKLYRQFILHFVSVRETNSQTSSQIPESSPAQQLPGQNRPTWSSTMKNPPYPQ